jgi:hypothetical protein
LSISFLCSLLAAPAQAGVQRAHVSAAFGSDANTTYNCDAVHPCRFFQAAATVVNPGGEVVAIDSGGYGTVTITQSISLIAAPGAYAGISVFAGANGINIATAGVVVALKGLTINGMGGDYGINMTSGSSLTVENCSFSNFGTFLKGGIHVVGAIGVRILNSVFRDNSWGVWIDDGATASISGSQFYGNYVAADISVHTAGAISTMTVEHSLASNGSYGFVAEDYAAGTTHLYITDSVVTGNSTFGIGVYADSSGTSDGSITNSLISGNGGSGIRSSNSGAKLVVSGSTVTNNSIGLNLTNGGVIESAGNNTVRNNTTQTAGTITTFALQ